MGLLEEQYFPCIPNHILFLLTFSMCCSCPYKVSTVACSMQTIGTHYFLIPWPLELWPSCSYTHHKGLWVRIARNRVVTITALLQYCGHVMPPAGLNSLPSSLQSENTTAVVVSQVRNAASDWFTSQEYSLWLVDRLNPRHLGIAYGRLTTYSYPHSANKNWCDHGDITVMSPALFAQTWPSSSSSRATDDIIQLFLQAEWNPWQVSWCQIIKSHVTSSWTTMYFIQSSDCLWILSLLILSSGI